MTVLVKKLLTVRGSFSVVFPKRIVEQRELLFLLSILPHLAHDKNFRIGKNSSVFNVKS